MIDKQFLQFVLYNSPIVSSLFSTYLQMTRSKKPSKSHRRKHFKRQISGGVHVPHSPTRPLKARYLDTMAALEVKAKEVGAKAKEAEEFGVVQQYEIGQLQEQLQEQKDQTNQYQQKLQELQEQYNDLDMITTEQKLTMSRDLFGLDRELENSRRELAASRAEVGKLQEEIARRGRRQGRRN